MKAIRPYAAALLALVTGSATVAASCPAGTTPTAWSLRFSLQPTGGESLLGFSYTSQSGTARNQVFPSPGQGCDRVEIASVTDVISSVPASELSEYDVCKDARTGRLEKGT